MATEEFGDWTYEAAFNWKQPLRFRSTPGRGDEVKDNIKCKIGEKITIVARANTEGVDWIKVRDRGWLPVALKQGKKIMLKESASTVAASDAPQVVGEVETTETDDGVQTAAETASAAADEAPAQVSAPPASTPPAAKSVGWVEDADTAADSLISHCIARGLSQHGEEQKFLDDETHVATQKLQQRMRQQKKVRGGNSADNVSPKRRTPTVPRARRHGHAVLRRSEIRMKNTSSVRMNRQYLVGHAAAVRTEGSGSEPTEGVLMASYSEAGGRIVTAGGDGKAMIWTRSETGWTRRVTIPYPFGNPEERDAEWNVANPMSSVHVTTPKLTRNTHSLTISSAVFAPVPGGGNSQSMWKFLPDVEYIGEENGVCHVMLAGDAGYVQIFRVDLAQCGNSDIHLGDCSVDADAFGQPVDAWGQPTGTGAVRLVSQFHHWHVVGTRAPRVRTAKFSPSGEFVATASLGDKSARIWGVDSKTYVDPNKYELDRVHHVCLRILTHDSLVWSAEWAPDNNTVLTSSHDKVAILWCNLNLHTPSFGHGDLHHTDVTGQSKSTRSARTIGHDQRELPIKLKSSKEQMRRFQVKDYSYEQLLAKLTNRGYTKEALKKLRTKQDCLAELQYTIELRAHSGAVPKAVFHPHFGDSGGRNPTERYGRSTKVVATCSYDKTVMLWSTKTKRRMHTFHGHTDRVWCVAFSHLGVKTNNLLVSSSQDKTVRVWDIDAKACVAVLTGHTGTVWSCSFSPPYLDKLRSAKGKHFNKGLQQLKAEFKVRGLNFENVDDYNGEGSDIVKWSLSSLRDELQRRGIPHEGLYKDECVSALTEDQNRVCRVCTVKGAEELQKQRLVHALVCDEIGEEGDQIITASVDCDVIVWDSRADDGIVVLRPIDKDEGVHHSSAVDSEAAEANLKEAEICSIAFSPQTTAEFATAGKAPGGGGGIVRIWSQPHLRAKVFKFRQFLESAKKAKIATQQHKNHANALEVQREKERNVECTPSYCKYLIQTKMPFCSRASRTEQCDMEDRCELPPRLHLDQTQMHMVADHSVHNGEGSDIAKWSLSSLRDELQRRGIEHESLDKDECVSEVIDRREDDVSHLREADFLCRKGMQKCSSSDKSGPHFFTLPRKYPDEKGNLVGDVGHSLPVWCVEFSHDGTRLVTASGDLTVIVWERRERSLLGRVTEESPAPAAGCEQTPRVAWVPITTIDLVASKEHPLVSSEKSASPRASATLKGFKIDPHPDEEISEARFHPLKNTVIVIGSGNKSNARKRGVLTVWTAPKGGSFVQQEWTPTVYHDDTLVDGETGIAHAHLTTTVGWSPDGKKILSGSQDTSVAIWDVATGALLQRIHTGGTRAIGSAAFSPDGKKFAFVGAASTLAVYCANSYTKFFANRIHTSRAFSLAWSHDSTMIATAGLEDNVLVSDANTGEIIVKLADQGCQTVNSVVFSKTDTKIATASDVGRVIFWPVAPFSTRETLDMLRSHPGARPTAKYLEKLHLLNTWSDVYLPERRGYTALHLLAERGVDGTYWGEGDGHDDYYEQLLDNWSLSNIPYAPVLNNAGQSPLEVAILTRNHSFFDHLCEKKGLLDVFPNFEGSDGGDEEVSHHTITLRDLDVMLDWSTSRRAVVKYLQQPALLVPVDHTLFNCHT